MIKKLEKKQVSGLCSRGKESKEFILLVIFLIGQECYKLKSAGMSQVMVAHVFQKLKSETG